MVENANVFKEVMQSIVSQLPIGISVYDPNGQCVMANKIIAEMIGATLEGVISQNYHNIKSWKDSGIYDAALNSLREDVSVNFTSELTTSFGKHLFVNYYIFPANIRGMRHLVFIMEDISEKQKALNAHEQTTMMLNETQEITKIGSLTIILKTSNMLLSKNAKKMLGFNDGDVDIKHEDILAIIPIEDREYVSKSIDNAISLASTFDIIHRIIPYGKVRWVHGRGRVECDKFGCPEIVKGSMEDITEQRLLIAELKEAKERAEAANVAKSEFLSVMTHELRTPMNAICGYNDLLTSTGLNEKQIDYVKRASVATQTMLKIIDDILQYASLQAGKLMLNMEGFRPRDMIDRVVDILDVAAQKKGLLLTYSINKLVPEYVIGDISKIIQVIINLVGNAIKYTKTGGVKIDISFEQIGNDTNAIGNLFVSVSDTGIGIQHDKTQIIFERFQQLDGSYSRDNDGVGLGLAICRKLCDAMGGEICVESEVGIGTTFWFRIPCPPAI